MVVSKRYDVFLSHNGADKPAVEHLAQKLRNAGLTPFLDTWHLVPGEPWQEGLEAALDQSRTCAVFLGSAGLGPWENEEMRAALEERVANPAFRVIPVLLPGAALPDREQLPRFLRRLTWVDLRNGLADSDGLQRLIGGISGVAPGPRANGAAASDVRPYLGLNTFQEQHTAFFFGREALVELLLEKVRSEPFLAVLGPSGSGKSSVVLAGLLPALKQGALPGSAGWRYLDPFTPGARPLDALAAGLARLQGGDLGSVLSLGRALAESDRALLLTAEVLGLRQGARLVLVVDQFEELWTLAPSEPGARADHVAQQQHPFVRLLLTAVTTPASPLLVVLTMRADFLHRAAEQRELAGAIGEHDVIVSPMAVDEVRSAITRPAAAVGCAFEPGLVDELIDQSVGRVGALPLLEYTLLELWKARRPDGMMTWDAFRVLGGIEGALAARADAILAEHYRSTEQQDALRRILLRLVQPGEGVADTRRRALLADTIPAGRSAETVQGLLKPLADERLITTSRDLTTGAETIEISHEALIRAWPTLGKWIDEARSDVRFQLQMEEAANEWRASGENPDLLWSGLRLAQAEAWMERTRPQLNERDRRFLDAGREQAQARAAAAEADRREREALLEARAAAEKRSASRLRIFLGVAGALVLVLVGITWFAYDRQRAATAAALDARERQRAADRAAEEARVQARAGEVLFELSAKNYDRALLLARSAVDTITPPYPSIVSRALRRAFEDTVPSRVLRGHSGGVRAAVWSPNGEQVVTAGEDGTGRIWEVASGKQVHVLEGHSGGVDATAWSPNGEQVLTVGDDGTARIWIAGNHLMVAEITRRVCNLFSDDDIREHISSWSGCEEELRAVAADLKTYDSLTGRR